MSEKIEYQIKSIPSNLKTSLYHSIPESNDIAIVTLKNEVSFKKASIPACLSKLEEPRENESAIVVGWGLTSFDGIQSRYTFETKKNVKSPVLMQGSCHLDKPSNVEIGVLLLYLFNVVVKLIFGYLQGLEKAG